MRMRVSGGHQCTCQVSQNADSNRPRVSRSWFLGPVSSHFEAAITHCSAGKPTITFTTFSQSSLVAAEHGPQFSHLHYPLDVPPGTLDALRNLVLARHRCHSESVHLLWTGSLRDPTKTLRYKDTSPYPRGVFVREVSGGGVTMASWLCIPGTVSSLYRPCCWIYLITGAGIR